MRKIDPKILPYLASITTAVMLMRAGVNFFGVWGWIIGPLAGLVASFSLAVAGSKISDIAKKRKSLAYLALFMMMALSPLVIYFSEYGEADEIVWGAVMWALFPDAAILLASTVTGQSLVAKDEPAKSQPKPKEASYKPAQPVFLCSVAGCTAKPFGSQSALNAHQRKHK